MIGETAGGWFLKSISNSFAYITLRSKKLFLHYVENLSNFAISCGMEFDKSTIAVSSDYLIKIVSSLPVQSYVYSVKRTRVKAYPCGTPVEADRSPDNTPLIRTPVEADRSPDNTPLIRTPVEADRSPDNTPLIRTPVEADRSPDNTPLIRTNCLQWHKSP